MKNTLKIVASLIVFILCLISIKVFLIDENEKGEEKEKSNVEIKKVELSYLVDDFVGYYENIELTETEKSELIKIFNSLDYETKKIDIDLAIIPKYKLIFDDKVLYFSDGDEEYANLIINNHAEIIETKNLKAKIKEYMKNKNLERVFLFERYDITTTEFVKIEISDDDKQLLIENFSYQEDIEPVNLMIAGMYVLVIDGVSLSFDDINSNYAMVDGQMVIKNNNLNEILKKYIKTEINDDNGECCSCCPDLKPGETCISMCCPCS